MTYYIVGTSPDGDKTKFKQPDGQIYFWEDMNHAITWAEQLAERFQGHLFEVVDENGDTVNGVYITSHAEVV